MVSQWVIGSELPRRIPQNRSISTSQPGRSPRPIRSALRRISGAVRDPEGGGHVPRTFGGEDDLQATEVAVVAYLGHLGRPVEHLEIVQQTTAYVLRGLAGAVGRAHTSSALIPVITRRANSWPRRCACQAPSGVSPDSDE